MLSIAAPPHRCALSALVPQDGEDDVPGNRQEDGRACKALKGLSLSAAMPTAQVLLWHNMTDERGTKMCFHQYDDGVRAPQGSTMTLDPGDDLYYVATCKH